MCETCGGVGARWEVINGSSSKGTMGEILRTNYEQLHPLWEDNTNLIGCDSDVLAWRLKLG